MTPKKDTLFYNTVNPQTGMADTGFVMPQPAGGLAETAENSIVKSIENFARPVTIDNKAIRMLLIDDNAADVARLQHVIRNMDCWEINLDWVSTMERAMENILRFNYDVCMMDAAMAAKKGIDLVGVISKNGASTPLILLKSDTDTHPDMALADEESTDCIDKASLSPELLKHCIRYTIERGRRVKKLKDAQKYLQALSSKLIDAQERERKNIGRELHDSIGSSLTAIRMALDAGNDGTEKNAGVADKVRLGEILSMIDETIEETRRISEKLRPAILDDLGLVKTISWMNRNFQKLIPGITIHTDIGISEFTVPEPLKIVIYRILQEVFNNIAKHSNADAVDLTMTITDGRLELSIHDNGNGFDPENLPSPGQTSGGYGLEGMQDRVKFTQGSFKIISEKGKGTTLRISWPIPAEAGF